MELPPPEEGGDFMRLTFCCLTLVAIVALAPAASADVITTYTDRPTFEAAAGVPLTVEDFTDTAHFPLTSGVLNSLTTDAGLQPGDIEEGVTYSTPVGQGNFFNIDAGGGYVGGFLDGFNPSDRDVTIVFHEADPGTPRTVKAFGFDLGGLDATDIDVRIQFDGGPDQVFNVAYVPFGFWGFVSDAQDIKGVVISNNNSFFGFDFDNFTYDAVGVALAISGTCPGTVRLRVSDATPNGKVALGRSPKTGTFIIPGGACAGTKLDLDNPSKLAIVTADGDGDVTLSRNAPPGACGVFLQAVDLSSCGVSNVVQVP
jgi:hypothetical protein